MLALRQLQSRGGGPVRRCTIIGLTVLATIVVVALTAAALFAARLTQGPLSIADLGPRIAEALDQKVGAGYAFTLGATSIEAGTRGLALSIGGLALRDTTGRPIIVAPKAEVSLDPLALLFGRVRATRLDIFDVDVRLSVLPDGSVAVSAGSDPIVLARPIGASENSVNPAPETTQRPQGGTTGAPPIRQVADGLTRLLDVVTSTDSPFGALERVGIARGRLVFDDRTLGETTAFSAFELTYEKTGDRVDLRIAADGLNGRWQVSAEADGAQGGNRSFDVGLQNISLDQIVLVGGFRDLGFDFDMPISSKLHFGLDPHGNLDQASGQFTLGSGYFFVKNPDHEPMLVDELTGGFHWDAKDGRIEFDPTQFFSGQTHFEVNATVVPPQVASEGWRIEASTSPGGVVGAERPGETPIALQAHFNGQLFASERRLTIDHFDLSGPQVNFAMTGGITWGSEADTRIKLAATASQVPMRPLVRIWPSFIAPPVHAWFLKNVLAGTLEKGAIAVDFSGADLAAMRARKPLPVESAQVDFTLADGTVSFLPGVPPLSGVSGSGHVTGRTVEFAATGGTLDDGGGRLLTMTDGTFEVADSSIQPTPAAIKVHVLGGLDAVSDVLSRDALKNIGGGLPIDTATVKGQVDARLSIDLKVGKDIPPEDTSVRANATVSNFSVDKLLAKEKLDQVTLAVVFDRSSLRAQGTGQMFGAPATIELRKPPSGVTEAEVSVTLDDAARSKLGWTFGPGLVGPIGARFVSALGQGDTTHSQVELDFTHADIEGLLPGYVKPAGRPAKATFAVTTDAEGTRIDQLVFDGATASARGSVQFDANGGFVTAHLSPVRLSPGDDMKVDVDQVKDVLKLTIRGTTIDVQPLLAMARTAGSDTGDDTGRSESAAAKDFELDFKSALVTGYNKQSMTGVELHLARHNGALSQFEFVGRLGRETVSGVTVQPPDGTPAQINLSASDAGALLAFTGLYRRMEGGQLQLITRLGDSRVDGQFSVRNFILRDEPAIRRLVSEGVPMRDERDGTVVIKVDPTAARFTRLQADFVRTGGRLDIRDGVMYSPEIGTELDGWLDFANDRVNMTGTFVPVYGVNNLFSQIPLFGPILGGGTHEGLFAVNFRISGAATAPVLNINPLSAIAPGFLRKIFGAIDLGAGQSPPLPPADPDAPLSLAPAR